MIKISGDPRNARTHERLKYSLANSSRKSTADLSTVSVLGNAANKKGRKSRNCNRLAFTLMTRSGLIADGFARSRFLSNSLIASITFESV
jgi:hypothetical protein